METNTTSPAAELYLFFIQNYDELENEVDHLGIFPSLKEAIKFRTQWICENYDMNDPNLEEEFMEEFREAFRGSPNDSWLDDGHAYFVIEKVKSYV